MGLVHYLSSTSVIWFDWLAGSIVVMVYVTSSINYILEVSNEVYKGLISKHFDLSNSDCDI